jgi:hypothetical protein
LFKEAMEQEMDFVQGTADVALSRADAYEFYGGELNR